MLIVILFVVATINVGKLLFPTKIAAMMI